MTTTAAAPLPADVMAFWVERYNSPFIETIVAYRQQFPERRASVDLPIFLYSITPMPSEAVQ